MKKLAMTFLMVSGVWCLALAAADPAPNFALAFVGAFCLSLHSGITWNRGE